MVTGEVTINGDVTVTGQTSIILRDGANLTINGGITLKPDDNKNKGLDLYGQKVQHMRSRKQQYRMLRPRQRSLLRI